MVLEMNNEPLEYNVLIVWTIFPTGYDPYPVASQFIELDVSQIEMNLLKTFHGVVINSMYNLALEYQARDFFYPNHGEFKFKSYLSEDALHHVGYDLIISCGVVI